MVNILTPSAIEFIDEWDNSDSTVIAHTSGSTGAPKEVRLLKKDMRKSAQATISFFNLTSDSCLYLSLSPSYIAGKMQIVRALEANCRIIVEEPSNYPLKSLPDDVEKISLLPIVPSQIDGVLSSEFTDLIENIIVGGAPLSPESEKRIIDSGIRSYATYGMTETCSHVALRQLGNDEFTALPSYTFSTDHRGCLVIKSHVMSFRELITNDIVSLSSPYSFRWLGRHDNVINSGGIKIYPEEIERKISALIPAGIKYYISSRPSSKWGEEVILVTDSHELTPRILHDIKTLIGSKLAPKELIHIPKVEFTSSQKIIRKKISD